MEEEKTTKKNIVKIGVFFPDHDFVIVDGQNKRIDKEKEIELPDNLEGFIIDIPYLED
jgi:hypothetical protein